VLMNKSTATPLAAILDPLTRAARSLGLSDTAWAARAGLRKETLSRLRHRSSCDFGSLVALAEAVGAHVTVATGHRQQTCPDNHFPAQLNRDYEHQLLTLCASRSLDPNVWATLGPPFFMAGLAVMIASVPGFERRGLLTVAEHLHPGASEPAVFALWLKRSPVRPSRFLPMLAMQVKHAA
jgi:hypothetical protein